jgi:hypothetical protein
VVRVEAVQVDVIADVYVGHWQCKTMYTIVLDGAFFPEYLCGWGGTTAEAPVIVSAVVITIF